MDQPSNSNSSSILTFPPTNEDEERVTEFYHYSGEEVETLRRIRTDLKLEGRKRLFVFSISGGTESQQPILKAKLENRLKTEFREIFVNDGRTLVITSGVDRGVVHTVGETLKSMDASDKKRLTCLGIMPDDTSYFIDCDLKTKEIVITTKDDESDALSPNRHHTHFLLLSHKEETNWLKKRTMFRQQLEQSLSNQAKEAGKQCFIIMLSINGGFETIREVANAVRDQNPIPVILFKGTGGATDFIERLCREDSNGYDEKVWADLLKHVKSYGHEMFDKEVEKDIKRDIKAIIKKKNQLRFYDWQLNTNASNASKDKKGHSLEEIIDEATCRDKENKLLLIEALRTQKTKRILKLLNGEKISALLQEQTVHDELYAKNKQGDRAEDDLDFRADKAVKKSIKQYYNLKYKSGQKQSTGDEQVTANENWNTTREISFRDIFLWAIITQRFDLAEYAWERLEEPIMASLVVSLAMKSVAEKVPQRQQKKKDDYTEISRKYERKAIEIIGIAHLSDAQKADKLLEDEHKCWNKFTCLEVAIGGKAKAFLSQDCCHYKLRKMWFGEIDVEESSPKVIALSPIYWLLGGFVSLKFSDDQIDNSHIKKCKNFYNSPVAKYGSHVATYVAFLVLYAWLMVFGRLDDTFHPLDIFLHVWILSMFIETTREMFHLYKHGRKFNRWKHFKEWITSIGNLISLATILSLCIAFICRWFPCTRQVARIFYGINISFFILRILRLYTASKTLGPLVTMVKLMLLRTLKFSAIFVIFLSAYAVAVQAVVGQFAGQSVTFYAVLDVFYQAYFQTFGELFLDELPGGESQPQTLIATIYICFLAAYLFMGHLLMLNLLIALFNRDIDKVDEQSKEIWIFEHYVLHNQFSKRPALPEPLSLLLYVYYLAKYLYSKCCGKSDMENPNNDQDKKFMRECLNDYIMQEQKRQEFSYKDKFDRLEDLGEEIKEDVDHWSKKIKHGTKYINKAKKTTIGTESKLYNRLTDLERQVSKLESLVERIDEWDPNGKVSKVKRWLLPYIHPSMREGNEGYLPLLKKGKRQRYYYTLEYEE